MLGTKSIAKAKSVERIVAPPPPHWVGDGFKVHGFFPNEMLSGKRMSPFYVLDYNSKTHLPPSPSPLGVGPHPHRGFETVTVAYHGSIAHADSMGNSGVIGQGDVQWMTAASGILHKEYHEDSFSRRGGLFQMVQIWVNLPAKFKMTKPQYQAITNEQMGRYPLPNDGGFIEIIAGDFKGIQGAATTFSPLHLYNAKPKKGTAFTISLPDNFTTAMVVIDGQVTINKSQLAPSDHFVLFKNDGEEIFIDAEEDSILLVMSGKPIDEPVAAHGPFVMNTREEIVQAFEDFRTGKFGRLAA